MKEFIENSELKYFLAGFTSHALYVNKHKGTQIRINLPNINMSFDWNFRLSSGYFVISNDILQKKSTGKLTSSFIYTQDVFKQRNEETKKVLNKLFEDEFERQLLNVSSINEEKGFLGGSFYQINASILGNLEHSVIVKYFKDRSIGVYAYGSGPCSKL